MDIKLIDEDYVRKLARTVDLELLPEHVSGVANYFRMISGFAAMLDEFPLDDHVENAPVFTPCSPPTAE